jgi:hypothetical protein
MSLIAIYIVQRVKRDTPYCGKETQVWNVHKGNPRSVLSPYIAQAESLFKKYEYEKSRTFLTMLSASNTSPTFSAYDEHVRKEMEKLREEFKKLFAGMEEMCQ